MSNRPIRVLAVSPGRRWTGVAATDGRVILRFTVVNTRGGTAVLARRFARLLDETSPDLVVVEAANFRRIRTAVADLAATVVATARARRLPVQPGLLALARRSVTAPERPTRQRVHAMLAERFPTLRWSTRTSLESRTGWWSEMDRYWERGFAALCLALHALGPQARSASRESTDQREGAPVDPVPA